jgi:hypothetical protein
VHYAARCRKTADMMQIPVEKVEREIQFVSQLWRISFMIIAKVIGYACMVPQERLLSIREIT